eukprot:XP_015576092.1 uncharacterized protein LOC8284649 [Ricinus communis]
MELKHLWQFLSFNLSTALSFLRLQFSGMPNLSAIFVTFIDAMLSLHFLLCSMSPCTIDLDDQTTLHFWVTNRRQFNRPNLVLIHGYGGNSRWQFLNQVRPLSKSFNLYIPDLLFFGDSYTNRTDRSDIFQAKCASEGLKKLGVEKYNVVGISYGGYVAYYMAENFNDEVKKVVIVSCGICYTEEQREEQLRKLGRNNNIYDLLVPRKPEDAREMLKLAMHKIKPTKWLPDSVICEFINVIANNHRKEKLELVDHLMAKRADKKLPILTQETLLIWGDQDSVFPVQLAYQLQRHLGPKSRVEIIKDTGHAANIESADAVNSLITSFVCGGQS